MGHVRSLAAAAAIACALCMGGCNRAPANRQADNAPSAPLPPTTHPDQFIADARVMLQKGQPMEALADLRRLSPADAQRPDAVALRRQALEEVGQPDPDDPANKTVAERNAVAAEMQKQYFTDGKEVVLRPDGTEDRTLRLRYSFLNRKWVYAFSNDKERVAKLQNAGFRDVYLTDGVEEVWYLPLVPGAKPEKQGKPRHERAIGTF